MQARLHKQVIGSQGTRLRCGARSPHETSISPCPHGQDHPFLFLLSASSSSDFSTMSNTAHYLALGEEQDMSNPSNNCYVCSRMRIKKPFWKQTGLSRVCLLCNNPFCEFHKGEEDGVCEINHDTYCSKKTHIDLHAPVKIFVSMEARRRALGEEAEIEG